MFDWAYLYICVSVAFILLTLQNTISLHAAIAVVAWQVMGMIWYKYGEVETQGRIMSACVFIGVCLVLYEIHRTEIFTVLVGIGVAAVIWVALAPKDAPYVVKAGLNADWLSAIAGTLIWTFGNERTA